GPLERGAAHHLLENMRKTSLAGVLLLLGLLIFGMRMSDFAWPRRELTQNVALNQPAVPPASAVLAPAKQVAPVVATSRKPTSRHHPSSTSAPASPAMLEIEVDHRFAEAHMAIWVDDELTYTHPLQGTEKKHLVVFHRVQGHEFHAVQISPGKHL